VAFSLLIPLSGHAVQCQRLNRIIPRYFQKTVDREFFDHERTRILELTQKNDFHLSSLKDAPFETKLAALEVLNPSILNAGETLPSLFESAPLLRRRRIQKKILSLMNTKNPLSQAGVDIKIEEIYLDALHVRYPILGQSLKKDETERMLHDLVKARLASREAGQVLKEMGLFDENPSRFTRILEKTLKGHALATSWNTQMNATALYRFMKGDHLRGIIIPPKLFLQRWVKIPDAMLERAASEGLEQVWNTEMKTYLMEKYQDLIRADIIYNRLQFVWENVVNLAFTYYYYEKIKQKNNNRKVASPPPVK
jgi:hypothetical protein